MLIDILGCGSVTFMNHVKIINTLKKREIKPIGCFDINLERSKRLSKIINCNSYNKEDDLYNSHSNTILIATPPNIHFQQICKALTAGKNVICEKPFVTCKEEAQYILDLSKKVNKEVFVGHFRRGFPSMIISRKFLKDKLNLIKSIEAFEGRRFDWKTFSNYTTSNKYGNVIYDTGSHLIDQILFVLSIDKTFFNYKINKMLKDNTEMTHEMKTMLSINIKNFSFPLEIYLSRKKQLLNIIRIKFDDSELIINTSFNDKIRMLHEGDVFDITEKWTNNYYPRNSMDCFALEYLLLKEKENEMRNLFLAENFVNLTDILQTLTEIN